MQAAWGRKLTGIKYWFCPLHTEIAQLFLELLLDSYQQSHRTTVADTEVNTLTWSGLVSENTYFFPFN